MSDSIQERGKNDLARINFNEDFHVRYWTNKYGVSEEQLKSAVREVGPSAAAVAQRLVSKG